MQMHHIILAGLVFWIGLVLVAAANMPGFLLFFRFSYSHFLALTSKTTRRSEDQFKCNVVVILVMCVNLDYLSVWVLVVNNWKYFCSVMKLFACPSNHKNGDNIYKLERIFKGCSKANSILLNP